MSELLLVPAQGSAPRGCSCTELCHCVLQAGWHQGIGTFLPASPEENRADGLEPQAKDTHGLLEHSEPQKEISRREKTHRL